MRHQKVLVGMARYGEIVHNYFLSTPVHKVHHEFGGDTYHVERPVEIPFFRKIYLVHGRHRDGFSARIVRSEIEVVHRGFKAGHSFCITVEESGQRLIFTLYSYTFYRGHALFIGEEEYLLLFVRCYLE